MGRRRQIAKGLRGAIGTNSHQQPAMGPPSDQEPGARMKESDQLRDRCPAVEVMVADANEVGTPEQWRWLRPSRGDPLAGDQMAQQPLPRDGHECPVGHDRSPRVADLASNRHHRPGRRCRPRLGQRRDRQRHAGLDTCLDPSVRRLDVVVHGTFAERDEQDVDTGRTQGFEFDRATRIGIHAHDRGGPQAESSGGQRGIGDAATQAPAARVICIDIPTGGADV